LKKNLPYILLVLVLAAVIALVWGGKDTTGKEKKLDLRVTLRKNEKTPYAAYAAYENLKYIFPSASVFAERKEPAAWDSVSSYDDNQAIIIITPQFYPNDYEMRKLIEFAKKGNDVFISSSVLSYSAQETLKCRTGFSQLSEVYGNDAGTSEDTLTVFLDKPPFADSRNFVYPGKKYDSYFSSYDETVSYDLGKDEKGNTNFIKLKTGQGNIYLHLAPMAFSNYFLLHKSNMRYYENVLSVIKPGVTKVLWDEYYLNKKRLSSDRKNDDNKKGWFASLMAYPSFRAGFWTLIGFLVLYVLLEMRRKQRVIPVITKPKNDSLDFVKTIGRLYYEKNDHKNLSKKMAAYFLEHIRSRYKLPTNRLDEEFIKKLQYKSDYDEKELLKIVSFINFIDDAPGISDSQLAGFHKQLEAFYKVS
jgi:hypothetical protein